MKKRYQLILFFVIVSLGILVIDNSLFGILGVACNCGDPGLAMMECEYACMGYGGCDDVFLQNPGYCQDNICCRKAWNWCAEGHRYVIGYHCVGCSDCYIW